jgi:hypothetical protein
MLEGGVAKAGGGREGITQRVRWQLIIETVCRTSYPTGLSSAAICQGVLQAMGTVAVANAGGAVACKHTIEDTLKRLATPRPAGQELPEHGVVVEQTASGDRLYFFRNPAAGGALLGPSLLDCCSPMRRSSMLPDCRVYVTLQGAACFARLHFVWGSTFSWEHVGSAFMRL